MMPLSALMSIIRTATSLVRVHFCAGMTGLDGGKVYTKILSFLFLVFLFRAYVSVSLFFLSTEFCKITCLLPMSMRGTCS